MATSTATSEGPNADWMNNLIPGYSGLVGQAGSVIGDLLHGTPSTSTARNAAATFGAANGQGVGGSGNIADRWGYDLYNQMGQQRQQQGMSDLNSLIGATSSPALTNQGQQMQNTQFGQNLAQQGSEWQQGFQETQFNDQINALLGLHNAGIGGTGGGAGGGGGGDSGNPFANLNSAVGQFQSYIPSTSQYTYL